MNHPVSDSALEPRLRAWAESSGCSLCVLFGSRAGGGPSVKGDVDVAVQFSELPGPERRLEMIGEVQDLCGASMADLVFIHVRTDPVLRFEIFRTGIPIYEAEPGAFVEAKVRALMVYEDALPFRRMLRERLREEFGRRGDVNVP